MVWKINELIELNEFSSFLNGSHLTPHHHLDSSFRDVFVTTFPSFFNYTAKNQSEKLSLAIFYSQSFIDSNLAKDHYTDTKIIPRKLFSLLQKVWKNLIHRDGLQEVQ